jgi:1-acyl-sn-glycerol-3-phosphate acyltransferase
MADMRTWFFHPGAIITSWILWVLGPGRVEGLENVPRQGAALVVANHCSNLDPLFVGWAVGHRTGRLVHFMAKEEMRRWPVIGFLARNAGVFFVRRGEGDRGAQRVAFRLLEEGRMVGVFPEGTRSRDGQLGDGRAGAALLAMRTGVPVLPVAISGTHAIFPGRSRWPHRSRVTIRIGKPFQVPVVADGLDRDALRQGTERMMRTIAELLPLDQRGRWGGESDQGAGSQGAGSQGAGI